MPLLYSQRLNCEITRSEFEIIVPGSQVPDWFFDYNSEGSPLRIDQPMIRCRGLALCAAFSVHDPNGLYPYNWMQLGCTVQLDITPTHAVSKTPRHTRKTCISAMSVPLNSLAGTDHLWLFYISLSYLTSTDIFYLRDVSFRDKTDESVKVKEYGLRPVYDSDSDIEEFIGASNNLSSNTSHEVLNPDRLAVTSSIIKRSRDCCPDQQPYPKRLK
ncbi:hypothetical protein Pint_07118 [Pistacia integerrima]|uniref:Uncharacterized protein n=1 Tax=Pistacia integerrima TaxID=434235 RepID=A0ACC0XSX1_9ROSI|nr:hypothetical protein Pint_07118 [Pistacia integerrima]